MRTACIAFTAKGAALAKRIGEILRKENQEVALYLKTRYGNPDICEKDGILFVESSLSDWASEQFSSCDSLIFVGASGIAVRAIAPFVKDKRKDPSVLVLDEKGNYCIPLLSGHLGGANEQALLLAERLPAVPVLTTATDVNDRFAVDVFAKKNGLQISSMAYAKEISAALLAGEQIGVYSPLPIIGKIPRGLILTDENGLGEDGKALKLGFVIASDNRIKPFAHTLYLIPKAVSLGIGCKRGISEDKIEALVWKVCEETGIFPEAIMRISSIDIKKDEPGLKKFAKRINVPFETWNAEALNALEGNFTGSDFVKQMTGVDNVCERCAIMGGGKLISGKTGMAGVTCACALEEWSVSYE